EPLIILPNPQFYQIMMAKIEPKNVGPTIAKIGQTYDNTFPDQILSSSFHDEELNRFYQDDPRLSRPCKIFGLITISIACLGLFGLAAFAASKRTKEIGIRKVLGAGGFSLFGLLSSEFLVLVTISFLLAAPASWILIQKWLGAFVYKEDVGVSIFIAGFTI